MLPARFRIILIPVSRYSAPVNPSSLPKFLRWFRLLSSAWLFSFKDSFSSWPFKTASVHMKTGILAFTGFAGIGMDGRGTILHCPAPEAHPPAIPTFPVRQASIIPPLVNCSPFAWRWPPEPCISAAGFASAYFLASSIIFSSEIPVISVAHAGVLTMPSSSPFKYAKYLSNPRHLSSTKKWSYKSSDQMT